MSDDLKALFPGREVAAGGETIKVSPFVFGQLPKVAKCFASIKGVIEGGNLIEIASAGGEDLLQLLCLAANKPRAWFDTLPSDEGLSLMAAVIQVNRDFFVQRMSPVLQRLTQAVNGTGALSSPDSSAPATDGATSQATP
ncbi:MAG: DUF6631 family protein [Xanthobacteraceae bacterium]